MLYRRIEGLMASDVFTIAKRADAAGLCIYGSRFIDTVKEWICDAFEKSRLVVQVFNDDHGFLTHGPTVQRASQRLLLALFSWDPTLTLFTRDVSQAYVEPETEIKRPIFVKPPSILGYSSEIIFRVNCPLYGIPESDIHWVYKYHSYHQQKLKMKPSVYDPCFLLIKHSLTISAEKKSNPRGIVCLETDDTAYVGNDAFFQLESVEKRAFDSKPTDSLKDGQSITFNGGIFKNIHNAYTLSQPQNVSKLKSLDEKTFTKEEFVAERTRGSYLTVVCRLESYFGFCSASQITAPDIKDLKDLNKVINYWIKDVDRGLKYIKLDMDSLIMAVFVDAGFASNQDISS